MPQCLAKNRLMLTLAAVISAAAPVLASRSGHDVSVLRAAGHARPEPAPTTPSSASADSSLAPLAPCPPPSEALLAPRQTTWLREWTASGVISAHAYQHDLRRGQAPDALLGICQSVPVLPGLALRILFCSWIV